MQKREQVASLLTQMFRQPLIARTAIGLVQQPIHSRFQQSGSHRQTVGRHFLAFITVVQQQGPLQQSFYLQGKLRRRPRRSLAHLFAAPDQVCQAGLMVGLFQLAVAAQTVMHQPTVVVRPQKLFQLLAAATRQDAVHRYQFALRHPQPLRTPAHPPTRFIYPVDPTLARRHQQPLVGWLGLARQAHHRFVYAAPADLQTISHLQHPPGVAQRQPHLLVQVRPIGQRLRSHLHFGRSQRVRRLQLVSPLRPRLAALAATHFDFKSSHHRLPHSVFLILRLDSLHLHRAPARATPRHRR